MALGRAEYAHRLTGHKVVILDANHQPRSHELWVGNPAWYGPKIETGRGNYVTIVDGPGARPYIKSHNGKQAIWNMEHRAAAGRVHLTEDERKNAVSGLPEAYIVVEPHNKPQASPNKSWGFDRWNQAVKGLPLPVVQLGATKPKLLDGAIYHPTPTMRHAAAVIEKAALVMTTEGGIHHLAASMNRPAVVVYGAFIPPEITGYDNHIKLAVPELGYCGKWSKCSQCEEAMASITPDSVRGAAMRLIHEPGVHRVRTALS